MTMKKVRFSITTIALAFFGTSALADDIFNKLRPAIDEGFDFTGVMIAQIGGWQEDPMVLQMYCVKDKGAKIIWIHPSTVQGQSFLDDGKTVHQYFPDINVVRVRPSFYSFWPSYSYLLGLVKKNYIVKDLGTETRLGRKVDVLSVTAKNSDLGERKVMIDQELPVVLEDVHKVGSRTVFRLKSFEFKELKASDIKLKLDLPIGVVTRNTWGPQKVTDIKIASGAIGFAPQIPSRLPYGFQIFSKQLVGMESDPFFVARIADGMLTCHVYQWKYKSGQAQSKLDIPAMLVDKKKDIAFSILGDIPPEAAMKVLKSFTVSQE